MIRNLLDNALTSVQGRGHIEVSTGREGAEVQVQVTDSRPGIPLADRERIFEPASFASTTASSQAPVSVSRSPAGSPASTTAR